MAMLAAKGIVEPSTKQIRAIYGRVHRSLVNGDGKVVLRVGEGMPGGGWGVHSKNAPTARFGASAPEILPREVVRSLRAACAPKNRQIVTLGHQRAGPCVRAAPSRFGCAAKDGRRMSFCGATRGVPSRNRRRDRLSSQCNYVAFGWTQDRFD
jgi:hypothetical protein